MYISRRETRFWGYESNFGVTGVQCKSDRSFDLWITDFSYSAIWMWWREETERSTGQGGICLTWHVLPYPVNSQGLLWNLEYRALKSAYKGSAAQGNFIFLLLHAQKAPSEENPWEIRNKEYKLKIQLASRYLGMRTRLPIHSASLPCESTTITYKVTNWHWISENWLWLCCESFTIYFSTVVSPTWWNGCSHS